MTTENKSYLLTTVNTELNKTYNMVANRYDKETLISAGYKKLPFKIWQTITTSEDVEGVVWVTYITRVK